MIRYLTAGESHGAELTGIVEGIPSGLRLDSSYIDRQLARRWQGFGRGGRSKLERDTIQICSGIRFSSTIGSPIALRLENAAHHRDKSDWPRQMAIDGTKEGVEPVTLPRPGHADLVGLLKYRFDDIRPVIERSSARETAMRVACCTIARRLLSELGIEIGSHVLQIGKIRLIRTDSIQKIVSDLIQNGAESINEVADRSEVRMIDPDLTRDSIQHIKEMKKAGDSLGGAYEVIVTGVPTGLGSYVHWDRKLDGQLAQAIVSIQGQKAVEIGDGIDAAEAPGSLIHDPIVLDEGRYSRSQNRAGGIEGGVSNGMPIVVRGYMKPIPTLIKPLESVDISTGQAQPTRYERSDVTSVPAASTVAEAVVAFTIANAVLEKYGGDSMDELKERFVQKG